MKRYSIKIRAFSYSISILFTLLIYPSLTKASQPFVSFEKEGFEWINEQRACPILLDKNEDKGVIDAVNNLQSDAKAVTGKTPGIYFSTDSPEILIIGSIEKSKWIRELIKNKKINPAELVGKREKFIIRTLNSPLSGIKKAVVIAGSDKRGTIYGIYELSAQMGVSPWYWWADVPIKKHNKVSIEEGVYSDGEPAVKYRGIFLNDEAPCLSGWAHEKFGGFNSKFYRKVFELILRLKGNFLWPAMWGNAFYDDDPKNGPLADEMGIVMGTSHHEPMGEAQQDWKRRGKGDWNYTTNAPLLRHFWREGIERCKNWESLITIGMRGDGDEPMSLQSNISLLQNIIRDQRKIISEVTEKKTSDTPQVWALYKEVQNYYDQGMRVPDDITLLLSDDNWGNLRKLPNPNEKPRKGGYGIYYHFDYVGAPRNYKWLNVTQIQRVWEQMNLAYNHGVKQLWIVNVGDLKPMEFPINFFMDMAWNPESVKSENLANYTRTFCAQQFGNEYADEAASLISLYTKYNSRITPELLCDTTYSLENYGEWERVDDEYRNLCLDALKLYYLIPQEYKDAFDQLVLYPIQACSNLYDMYYAVAMNRFLAGKNDTRANNWADKAIDCFRKDSLLSYYYNKVLNHGKWDHMMDQTHIGYTSWQDPPVNIIPAVKRVSIKTEKKQEFVFREKDGYVSMEAEHYTRSASGKKIKWKTIPDMGRTLSSVTTFPSSLKPDVNTYLEYDFQTAFKGEVGIHLLLSPTLNFNTKGLSFALSIDGGEETTINFNGKYDDRKLWDKWNAHRINETIVYLRLKAGKEKHTLRFRPLDEGIVLQKIMIDEGGLKPSYLGAPESEIE